MWSYIYYRAYLEWKEECEYNGNETYIMDLIQKEDTSWFPIGRSMEVLVEEDEDDEPAEKIKEVTTDVTPAP